MGDIKLYTILEAGDILKVTPRTVYNYVRAGQLETTKIGREHRITEEALRDFIKRGTDQNYLNMVKRPKKTTSKN